MREFLLRFWMVNYVPLYATYGQMFFILGLVVLLSNHRRSLLPLARALWLLGLFAITHAFREWGFIFIPVQATYLPTTVVNTMEWAQLGLLATSFLFLMGFPVYLLVLCGWLWRWAWGALVGMGLSWVGLLLLLYGVWDWPADQTFRAADLVARYGIAFPAGLLAAWATWYQGDEIRDWASEESVRWFRLLSLVFVGLAVTEGLITPEADFFPANVLNYNSILRFTGVPVPVYRMLAAAALALGAHAAVGLFEEEMQLRVQALEQERVLLADRERISRELHDHTVQALYAIGLEVETARILLPDSPEESRRMLVHIMNRLNTIIGEIRTYVYDLRQDTVETVPGIVQRALAASHAESLLNVEVTVDATLHNRPLPAGCSGHLQAILEEALSNVVKHAGVDQAQVLVTDEGDSVILSVRDEGRGFDPSTSHLGLGLHHMTERARLLGGVLHVRSTPGQGTEVRLIMPLTENLEVKGNGETAAGTPCRRPRGGAPGVKDVVGPAPGV